MLHNNTSQAPMHDTPAPAPIIQWATACAYMAIKSIAAMGGQHNANIGSTQITAAADGNDIIMLDPADAAAVTNHTWTSAIQDILNHRKPDYLADCAQEFLTALCQYVNLDQPVHCIRVQSRAIVYTTKTGKECSAYHVAVKAIRAYIRMTSNGTYTTTRRINGKAVNVPCLAIDHYTPGTEYRDGLSYNVDMHTEDTAKACHIAIIRAKSKAKHHDILTAIYNRLIAGYTQKEIAAMLDIPTSTIGRHVATLRDILGGQLAMMDTLDNRHK